MIAHAVMPITKHIISKIPSSIIAFLQSVDLVLEIAHRLPEAFHLLARILPTCLTNMLHHVAEVEGKVSANVLFTRRVLLRWWCKRVELSVREANRVVQVQFFLAPFSKSLLRSDLPLLRKDKTVVARDEESVGSWHGASTFKSKKTASVT